MGSPGSLVSSRPGGAWYGSRRVVSRWGRMSYSRNAAVIHHKFHQCNVHCHQRGCVEHSQSRLFGQNILYTTQTDHTLPPDNNSPMRFIPLWNRPLRLSQSPSMPSGEVINILSVGIGGLCGLTARSGSSCACALSDRGPLCAGAWAALNDGGRERKGL